MRVLDRLDDSPALVQTDLVDTLAMNPLAVALLGDKTRHTGLARSGYYRWFVTPPPAEAGGFSLRRVGVATDQPGP